MNSKSNNLEIKKFVNLFNVRSKDLHSKKREATSETFVRELQYNIDSTKLVLDNFLSLQNVSLQALDHIYNSEVQLRDEFQTFTTINPVTELKGKLEGIASNNAEEKNQQILEILHPYRYIFAIKAVNDKHKECLNAIFMCCSKSIATGVELFEDKSNAANKNAMIEFVKFVVTNLDPVISGIDTILNIFRKDIIKFKKTNELFVELEEYRQSCIKHAILSKYFEEVVIATMSNKEPSMVEIESCKELTVEKLTNGQFVYL